MEESRFFRWIARINAVGLLLCFTGLLGFIVFTVLREFLFAPAPVATTNLASDPQGKEKWSLGEARHLQGTGLIYLPLISERRSIEAPSAASGLKFAGSAGFRIPARNLLFVHPESGAMAWLFKDNSQLLTRVEELRLFHSEKTTVEALLYHVVRRDSNGDGRLNAEDLADLALSSPDGARFAVVATAVERALGAELTSRGTVQLFYQSAGKASVASIRASDLAVLSRRDIPAVEAAQE
ncbi:hypothetical protein BURK2_00101 [Burkholderiales bacterium]|nr:MAG: hypothetical protein F9K47_03015 [Burkholderiales bacterium]CAG0949411.1 hypothetical protein BURK2_00101 [Burkholderiales bacterium]